MGWFRRSSKRTEQVGRPHGKPRRNTLALSPCHRRLCLETLEDRRLLTVLSAPYVPPFHDAAAGLGGPVSLTRIISLSGNLAFGNVAVGSSAESSLIISNNGNSTLVVSGISCPNGFSGDWSGTIMAGSSHAVPVTFSPTSAASYGGAVTVDADSTSGTNTITASGTGTVATTRVISLSGNLAFGDVAVGSSTESSLTIANKGNSTLTVSGITCPSGFSGNWSGTIAAGGSHVVPVTFSPTSAASYGGTVTVDANQTSGTNTATASGTGTVATTRIISLSGNLAFGNVAIGSSAQSSLTIANNGNSTLTVSGITCPSGFSGDWSGTITAGSSRVVPVTFSPTAATSYGGAVTVNADQTSGTNTAAASGTGTAAVVTRIISLSGNLAFGDVAAGSSAESSLTIANIGNSTLTVSGISCPSGFSGNWSGTITAGSSRVVAVTFSPTAATSYGGAVTVNADQTSGTNTATASGTGTAATTRIISLSGNLAFGNVAVGSSAESSLTIANNGNSTLVVSGISCPSGFSGDWSGTIAAGGSHAVAVTFSPTSATNYGGAVTIDADQTSGTNTATASGTGTAAAATRIISLSGNLAFGNVAVGSAAKSSLTIANNGNSTLVVSGISCPSGFSGDWSGTITAGSSHAVPIMFSPTLATSYGGAVTVNADQTSGTNTTAASGTGTAAAATRIISLSGNLAFGDVAAGSSAQSSLIISNNGNSTLTVSGVSCPSGFSGNWSGTIAAGGSHAVPITFSPTSATSYGGAVTVNSDATSGTSTATASGRGMAATTRIISLSGNLAFGNVTVGSSAKGNLTIANNGNSTLVVSGISCPSGFDGDWSGTITAGSSRTVPVTFSPTSATSYGGAVTVDADATSGTNTIAASGTGTAAATRIISLSGNLAFGNVAVGSSTESSLTISNNGNSPLTVSGISYPNGFSGNWSGTIAAGGSQVVPVTFSPTAATWYGGVVTINSDATSGTSAISASGRGGVTSQPTFSAHYDFGTATSPVQVGYRQVTDTTKFSSTLKFGWLSGTIRSADRGVGTTLDRDFNYTKDGTFAVDLPNGTYQVAMDLGDTGPYAHDVAVFLQGTQVDMVSTGKGQIVSRSYTVNVTGGQLDLRLKGLGGASSYACIEALDIAAL